MARGAQRSRRYVPGTADVATRWQVNLRRELFLALGLDDLVGSNAVPLDERVCSSTAHDGYARHELALQSTPARRIDAVVTIPDGDAPAPGIVCIHGHGSDRFAVHDPESIYKGFAAALATAGYATVAVDVGQHEVYEAGRLLMGERLWDCVRAVDLLAAHPRVDAGRLGCAGLSLGGEMAMWLGALDERIGVEVSAGFLTTMDQMEANHCMCWKFAGLRELVDYADLYALTAPRALMCQNGEQEGETQFHVPLARQALTEIEPIYTDLGHPERLQLHVHDGGHEIDLPALLGFFDRWL